MENPGSGSIGGALAPEGLEEETRPAVPTRLQRILVDLERDANTHAEWAADNNASGKGERGASHHTRNADDPPLAHGMVWHEWEAIDGDGEREGTRIAFGASHKALPQGALVPTFLIKSCDSEGVVIADIKGLIGPLG